LLAIYTREDKNAWNNYVKTYANWDIYYLYEYAYSFMLHGDGEPLLLAFENGSERFCYVVMQKDITTSDKFSGLLAEEAYYDWETPYGYGGPLTNGTISIASQKIFWQEIKQHCTQNRIVSQFVRFHPLLKNHAAIPEVIETRYMRDTIYIDTASPELIMRNMDSKNRNMVRKAIKSGVVIEHRDVADYQDFIPMYQETMEKNGADPYYLFDKAYFDSLGMMKENACILYAMLDGEPISSSILFYNDRYMHYHLSGSCTECRKYSPSNLLLYEAACMASRMGIKQFHLGGGMSPEDSLFGFKKQFNKSGRVPFVVGRTIFDPKAYKELLYIRKEQNPEFDVENSFMIQYRR